MDVDAHSSERGETKGTCSCEEVVYLPEGKGFLGVQPLSMMMAQDAHTKGL